MIYSANQFVNFLLCSKLKLRSFHDVEVPRWCPFRRHKETPVARCVWICGAQSGQRLMLMLMSASERGLSFSDTHSITLQCVCECVELRLGSG